MAPVTPLPATPFSTADADALVQFWRTTAKDHVLAPVGMAALRALSVAVSQTVVERQFSVLSNLEVDNRLHGSGRYVHNPADSALQRTLLRPLCRWLGQGTRHGRALVVFPLMCVPFLQQRWRKIADIAPALELLRLLPFAPGVNGPCYGRKVCSG
jgi:hypothetical protein